MMVAGAVNVPFKSNVWEVVEVVIHEDVAVKLCAVDPWQIVTPVAVGGVNIVTVALPSSPQQPPALLARK
jgi:hypothetical protein